MDLIHNLINRRGDITRDYDHITYGIKSETYSDDPEVASWIQTHVYQMTRLMDSENCGIRMWDDLFHEMFVQRDNHNLNMFVNTTTDVGDPRGVEIEQTITDSGDDCALALIRAHALAVSNFIDLGWEEMNSEHPLPGEC